jgi:hypothetical protein
MVGSIFFVMEISSAIPRLQIIYKNRKSFVGEDFTAINSGFATENNHLLCACNNQPIPGVATGKNKAPLQYLN